MKETPEFSYSLFDHTYPLPLTEEPNKTKERLLLVATLSFAKHGYAEVSMRDLAKAMGINQSSIYNHFASKEALWKEVIDHASRLYTLYFDILNEKLAAATSFEEVLEAIFYHPKRILNIFSCYAFSMIQTEQFHDAHAGSLFEEVFMTYAVDCLAAWLEKCVAQGLVRAFDTRTVAIIIVHSMLMGLQVEVHNLLNHPFKRPYDPKKMIQGVQDYILWSVKGRQDGDKDTAPRHS